jgi:ribosomal protein S6E (S10)
LFRITGAKREIQLANKSEAGSKTIRKKDPGSIYFKLKNKKYEIRYNGGRDYPGLARYRSVIGENKWKS